MSNTVVVNMPPMPQFSDFKVSIHGMNDEQELHKQQCLYEKALWEWKKACEALAKQVK
jgi:hypothetical protein